MILLSANSPIINKTNKDGNKSKQSKNYVQDLGNKNKQMEVDKTLAEGIQYHKRNEQLSNEPEFLKRKNREDHTEGIQVEEVAKGQGKEADKGNNPPFVPLLSLNKIQ